MQRSIQQVCTDLCNMEHILTSTDQQKLIDAYYYSVVGKNGVKIVESLPIKQEREMRKMHARYFKQ